MAILSEALLNAVQPIEAKKSNTPRHIAFAVMNRVDDRYQQMALSRRA
jgi:hypothetical protein